MTANEVRQKFLEFFSSKSHDIVNSAPIVLKNDPTLMFTNAGMNQFKDYFLGNIKSPSPRIADTQKCLRVSGKHNDLEEVGVDTYHHTMFEMLGNWSFGDYFKKEAIAWSWELLTEVYKLPKDRLYATVFEGNSKENVPKDDEAYTYWKQYLPESQILMGNKKDNFWEMGDTGPCGPCTEIHFDNRSDAERALIGGDKLVNKDHPQVIEIWNNVFIQFNRLSNGSLEPLPDKHVDTGMGFERLVRVIQGKQSNYDTDVFMPIIEKIEELTNVKYGVNEYTDIACRVIADHLRAISFTICDGQLPSNTAAGYVIRRILRRAVRYAFSRLNCKEALLYKLVPVLVKQFSNQFPEIKQNQLFIQNVIYEEENAFLRTLDAGIKKFTQIEKEQQSQNSKIINGKAAFELLDTYGFPIDLTRLMANEQGLSIDEKGFTEALNEQKERARAAAKVETSDWTILIDDAETDFVGYDTLWAACQIVKYRLVKQNNKTQYQLVLNRTPFYAESGGQVGDSGTLTFDNEVIEVLDTKKENNLVVHFVDKLPQKVNSLGAAQVNVERRKNIAANHTSTHLLHAALRKVLGVHVEQKGSMVSADYLRFDFSHFAKISEEQMQEIENIVNNKIRENIATQIQYLSKEEALQLGAMALFGEKYGNIVRVVTIDPAYSVELCGGTHVSATGEIGMCKIISESAVAAGVRRIEALSSTKGYEFINQQLDKLLQINSMFATTKDLVKSIEQTIHENTTLKKQIEHYYLQQANVTKNILKNKIKTHNNFNFVFERIEAPNAEIVKKICFDLKNETPNLIAVLGAAIDEKAHLAIIIDENLVKNKNLDASKMVRTIAKHVQGGGGGQLFFATAGGKNPQGIEAALDEAKSLCF